MRTRLLLVSSLFILLIMGLFSSAQNATLWGPGEDYEIDYLHSGKLQINSTILENFENQPSTEFTIQNITNDGYDYIYIGYGENQRSDQIRIQTASYGGISVEFPVGGMPVMLPLSYGDSDDWLEKFHTQLSLVSSSFSDDNQDLSILNSTLNNELLTLRLSSTFSGSLSSDDQFFDLPLLYNEFSESIFHNGSFLGDISYKRETGVMFTLNFTIVSEEVHNPNNVSLGRYSSTQRLDFVAIIPPTSIIDNLTAGSSFVFFIWGIALSILIRNKTR